MRVRLIILLITSIIAPAQAQTLLPWFGSEASAPIQINLNDENQQLIDSAQVSTANTLIDCPIEGCPIDQKIVKQPE
jgi:hypothetical protein